MGGTKKKPPSRSGGRGPTKHQKAAEAMLAAVDEAYDEVTDDPPMRRVRGDRHRGHPLGFKGKPHKSVIASKIAGRLSHKRRITRSLIHLVGGAAKLATTGVAYTAVGAGQGAKHTGRGTKELHRRTVRRIDERRNPTFPEGYDPEPGETPFGRLRCLGCDRKFGDVKSLNAHFEQHLSEPLIYKQAVTAETKAAEVVSLEKLLRRSPGGKRVTVNLDGAKPAQRRRHAAGRTTPENRKVVAFAKANKQTMHKIGARGMANDPAIAQIMRGIKMLHDSNHQGLSEMEEFALGFERAMAEFGEELKDYAMRLTRPYKDRTAISPDLVVPFFRNAAENVEKAGTALSRFIANYQVELNELIKAAKQNQETGGEKFMAS